MLIRWDNNLPQKLKSLGFMQDYDGLTENDFESEMNFISDQLNFYISKKPN